MTKMYIYNVDTNVVVATVTADSIMDCEQKMNDANLDWEQYAATGSPSFGCVDGLIMGDNIDTY